MKCLICNKEYSGKALKYCSKECAKIGRRNIQQRKPISIHTYTCVYCNKEYHPKEKSRDKYCSRDCFFNHGKERVIENKLLQEQGKELLRIKRAEHKMAMDKLRAKLKEEHIARKNEEKIQYQLNVILHTCKNCGNEFKATKRRTSCDECLHKNYRKKELGERVKVGKIDYSINLKELIQRDNGICKLCNREVNTLVHSNHNEYPSIDHIYPLAKGGTHSWDNVQLAHRICNSIKCDRV